MRTLPRFPLFSILLFVVLVLAACGKSTPSPEASVTAPAVPSKPVSPGSPCGDGICEGPENPQNCPQDCQAEQQATTVPGDACQDPNPKRAVVSEELLDWHDWLEDGSFEQGQASVVLSAFPQGNFSLGTVERNQQAAHSGSWGFAITTTSSQALVFSLKFFMEKGENTRFSFWARSTGANLSLKPIVEGVDFSGGTTSSSTIYSSDKEYSIGSAWTQVSFETKFAHANDYALLSLAIPPNSSLYLDDAAVELPAWKMASYTGDYRTVGGIPVPNEPVAPVHLNFLIHIEDPAQIQVNESYFRTKTAVFQELAKTFHDHGGFLTIQPEEDWVMGANNFAPDTLSDLVRDYDVVFSTHTHGPHCLDDQGRLRSYSDCNANLDTPGWDQSVEDYQYPYVVDYVRDLSQLISTAAGIPVTDHNGNWEFDQASRFSEIPMLTWSAYKAWRTQETYDYLINNPWRPSQVSADEDIEAFLTHDPDTQIVYIPGWGQAVTRQPERLLERVSPILSQFIYYADPQRVNTVYFVMHVDHFFSRTGDPDYIAYDPASGKLTYSDEFRQHLAYVDQMLTTLIDPLVQAGYVEWTSLPEIGELYQQWEAACGGTAAVAPTQAATMPEMAGASYEPPINVAMILHLDPNVSPEDTAFKATADIYDRAHDEIDWLMGEASRHDLNFTALYNGWYTQWALENDDLDQFRQLLAAGHELGSHAHRITYNAQTDEWDLLVDVLDRYGQPNYDAALARQSWADADHYMDLVLEQLGVSGQNRTMCAVPFKCSDEGTLMDAFGFDFSPGNRSEKGTMYFGHTVWNPWRPAASDIPGHELEEDLTSSYLALDHYAQIGSYESHNMDLTVPRLQKEFLMLYTEWLSRLRSGAEDKVWNFGFVYHPNQGDKYNADLAEFLDWLDKNFVNRTTPQGYSIARYATVSGIGQEYLDWEAAHPGVSSFSYIRDDPYPYTYEIVPQKLDETLYEKDVNLGAGVTCYQFTKGGQSIYLVWSDSGSKTVDFSSVLAGTLHLTYSDGTTGTSPAAALHLTGEPLFVEQ